MVLSRGDLAILSYLTFALLIHQISATEDNYVYYKTECYKCKRCNKTNINSTPRCFSSGGCFVYTPNNLTAPTRGCVSSKKVGICQGGMRRQSNRCFLCNESLCNGHEDSRSIDDNSTPSKFLQERSNVRNLHHQILLVFTSVLFLTN